MLRILTRKISRSCIDCETISNNTRRKHLKNFEILFLENDADTFFFIYIKVRTELKKCTLGALQQF